MNLCELKIYDTKLEIIYFDKKETYKFNTNLNINKYLENLNITPSIIFINIISVKENFNLELELKKNFSEIKFFVDNNIKLENLKLKIKNPHRLKYKNIKFIFFNNIFNYITNKKEILNKLKNLNIENSKFNLKVLNGGEKQVFEKIIFKNCVIEGNFSKIRIEDLKIISSIFVNTKTLILNKIKNLVLREVFNIKKIFIKKIESCSILDNNLNHVFVKDTKNLKIVNNKIKELKIETVNNLHILKNKFNYLFVENVNFVTLHKNVYKFKYIECSKIYVNPEELKYLYKSLNVVKIKKLVCMLEDLQDIVKLYFLFLHFNNVKIELKLVENYFKNKGISKNLFGKTNENYDLLKNFVMKFNKLAAIYKNDNILLYQITLKIFITKFLNLGINFPFIENKMLNNTLKI